MTEFQEEHHEERLKDAALLIDWENPKYSLSSKGRSVSISALRDAADNHGRLVVARAYADWQEPVHAGDAPNVCACGIAPSTGKTGQFNTILLNREHGDVQAALADDS
jgi:hypothetical protein